MGFINWIKGYKLPTENLKSWAKGLLSVSVGMNNTRLKEYIRECATAKEYLNELITEANKNAPNAAPYLRAITIHINTIETALDALDLKKVSNAAGYILDALKDAENNV